MFENSGLTEEQLDIVKFKCKLNNVNYLSCDTCSNSFYNWGSACNNKKLYFNEFLSESLEFRRGYKSNLFCMDWIKRGIND